MNSGKYKGQLKKCIKTLNLEKVKKVTFGKRNSK